MRNFGLFWHKLDTAAVAAATDTLKKILTDRTNNRKTLSKRGQFDYFVAPHNTTTTHWTEWTRVKLFVLFLYFTWLLARPFQNKFFQNIRKKILSHWRILRQDIHLCTTNPIWLFFFKKSKTMGSSLVSAFKPKLFPVTINLEKKSQHSTFHASKTIFIISKSRKYPGSC